MSSLAHNNIPFEAHLYPVGAHGLSLADKTVGVNSIYPSIPGWFDLAVKWAESL